MGRRARIFRAGVLGSLTTTTVLLLVGFVLALPAGAKTCTKNIAPPGHAGSSQYYETVPTSCGNASPPAGGSGSGSGSHSGIAQLGHGRAGVHSLSRLGTNGKAAASLAAATAPAVSKASSGGSGVKSGGAKSGSAGSGSGSGSASAGRAGSLGVGKSAGSGLPWTGSASGALDSVLGGSGGGLGVLLPILMGLGLVAAIAAGTVRARRSAGHSA